MFAKNCIFYPCAAIQLTFVLRLDYNTFIYTSECAKTISDALLINRLREQKQHRRCADLTISSRQQLTLSLKSGLVSSVNNYVLPVKKLVGKLYGQNQILFS